MTNNIHLTKAEIKKQTAKLNTQTKRKWNEIKRLKLALQIFTDVQNKKIYKLRNEMGKIDEQIKTLAISGKHTGGRKAIIQMDLHGNEIKRFISINEAARQFVSESSYYWADQIKSAASNITRVLSGKGKTAYKFRWKYVDKSDVGRRHQDMPEFKQRKMKALLNEKPIPRKDGRGNLY